MKNYLLLLSLFICVIGYSQDERLIYNEIIEKLLLKDYDNSRKSDSVTLLILPLQEFRNVPNYTYLKENFKSLKKLTFDNFAEVVRLSTKVENFEMKKTGIIFLETDNLDERQLIAKYPFWNFKKLRFSNIGFDDTKSQALVYYEFLSNSINGGRAYIVLCKKSKKWKIKKVIPSWST